MATLHSWPPPRGSPWLWALFSLAVLPSPGKGIKCLTYDKGGKKVVVEHTEAKTECKTCFVGKPKGGDKLEINCEILDELELKCGEGNDRYSSFCRCSEDCCNKPPKIGEQCPYCDKAPVKGCSATEEHIDGPDGDGDTVNYDDDKKGGTDEGTRGGAAGSLVALGVLLARLMMAPPFQAC